MKAYAVNGRCVIARNGAEEIRLENRLRRRTGRPRLTESERVGVYQRRACGFMPVTLRLVRGGQA